MQQCPSEVARSAPSHPGEDKLKSWGYPLEWAECVLSKLNTDRRVDYTNWFGFSAVVYGVEARQVMCVDLYTDDTNTLVWEVALFDEHGYGDAFFEKGALCVSMAGCPVKFMARGQCLDKMADMVRSVLFDIWDTNWACITL